MYGFRKRASESPSRRDTRRLCALKSSNKTKINHEGAKVTKKKKYDFKHGFFFCFVFFVPSWFNLLDL